MPEAKTKPEAPGTLNQDTINALAQLLSGGAQTQTRTEEPFLDIPSAGFVGLTPQEIGLAFRQSMVKERMGKQSVNDMFLNLQRISATKLNQARTRAAGIPDVTYPTELSSGLKVPLTPGQRATHERSGRDQERQRFEVARDAKPSTLPEGVTTFPEWLEWGRKSAATRITIGERREIETMKDEVSAIDYFKGDKFYGKALEEAGGALGTYKMDPGEKSEVIALWIHARIKARFPKALTRDQLVKTDPKFVGLPDGWYMPDGKLIRAWTE
jgi:hypothetical protein